MDSLIEYPTISIDPPMINGDNKHSKYINILSKLAITVEPVAQARIAACMVYHNNIISFGICKMKSHPFQAKFSKNQNSIFLHAETDCIKNALRIVDVNQLTKCTLYVCRVKYEDKSKKKFLFGMAKPCEGCSRAISTFNINRVYYSLDNEGYDFL